MEVLRRLPGFEWPRGVLLNVNFPAVPPTAVTGIEVTKQGRHKIGGTMVEGTDPRGQRYFWIAGERQQDKGLRGTDLGGARRRGLRDTALLDLTHRRAWRRFEALFGEPVRARWLIMELRRSGPIAEFAGSSSGCRAIYSFRKLSATRPTRTRRCRSAAIRP